ncbi:MAG: T9SS type A sorting domain-containing protein [Sphingobacteriaceae bacterium]|nr:T9SS type A sorting domain-containing protein [Sphingobacteriaceae bacterium]
MQKILVSILFLSAFFAQKSIMAQSAVNNTSVVSNCGCPGELWSFTTPYKPWVYFPMATNSKRLMHTNYNFNIPATASITGVKVEYGYTTFATPANTLKDSLVVLLLNGTMNGEDKSPESPYFGTSGNLSFGGPNDTWNMYLTPADINSPGFGFNFKLFSSVANAQLTVANGASITVYYNNAAGVKEWQNASEGMQVSFNRQYLTAKFNKAETSTIQILDLNGKMILSEEFQVADSASLRIENLKSGVYIYQIASGPHRKSGKFNID